MSNQATRGKGRPHRRESRKEGFRTDADIAGGEQVAQRKLEKWEGKDSHPAALGSLEDSKPGKWDQFEVNSRKFGVQDTFDEHLYTTVIDKSHPEYAERARKAEKLAREIEGQATTNVHQAEERGQKTEEVDEETKYSGVDRKVSQVEQAEQKQRADDEAEFKKKPAKKFNFAASAAKAASFRPVQQQQPQFFAPAPYVDPSQYGQPVMVPYGYPPQNFHSYPNFQPPRNTR